MDPLQDQDGAITVAASTGALTQVVKDKKKKKKKKLTPKERALERLEKASSKILDDSEKFNNLIVSVSFWLRKKEKIVNKLLKNQSLQSIDHEAFLETVRKKKEEKEREKQENEFQLTEASKSDIVESPVASDEFMVSYDDFKLVTSDLDIPCTNVQQHVICKILDQNSTGKLDYRSFTCDFLDSQIRRHHIDGIRLITKTEPTKYMHQITFKKELTKHFASSSPLYIKLDLKHVTFVNEKDFRGHIKDEIVNTKWKIISLVELLKERLDIASYKITLFQDQTKAKGSNLDEGRTLESYGYTGTDYQQALSNNEKTILYFDYYILNNDDPILNCDFYFNDYKFKK
ncbi:Calcium-dependent kinase 5 [Brachionus plicatilis]|uniref:Calcium-dependent kinase 5 n=1 Tax=Brachionus plicatilis TaxID=10195 RepID=A0A3M7Q3D6_BRAPC|nr:Calcium-dependent kinase 5 [Brachionus plicatilis]